MLKYSFALALIALEEYYRLVQALLAHVRVQLRI